MSGTLSTDAIGWQHARSADVLFSADWTHTPNAAGHVGDTRQSGVAGHGTSSPYDVTATFVVSGPAFLPGAQAAAPNSNADIVPTILHLLGRPSTPNGITGRPLLELMRQRVITPVTATRDSIVAERAGYRTVAYRTRVLHTWYFDSTRTTRR